MRRVYIMKNGINNSIWLEMSIFQMLNKLKLNKIEKIISVISVKSILIF